jgi:hypothetical protein
MVLVDKTIHRPTVQRENRERLGRRALQPDPDVAQKS